MTLPGFARRAASLLLALLLAACAAADFNLPRGAALPPAAAGHRFYAELCALSQIMKHPGFGADIRGGIGGHAVFYLTGACRVRDAGYPVLRLCDQPGDADGVGLSMNAHYANAKWVAFEGRDFFFDGLLAPGQAVTRDNYRALQQEAQRRQVFAGITFHEEVFADMPAGWSRQDWMHEVSIATDYAIAFGRGRYCAGVPLDEAQMRRIIDFLNAENAPYRRGEAVFHWSLFSDNCVHLAHNALALAGIWEPWPTHRPLLVSVFDFPVPRNEFVNLMLRTNDLDISDLWALYEDTAARRRLLQHGDLPLLPGALARAAPPHRPNEVYETELSLLFYDEWVLDRYQRRFDRIFATPRYTDAAANAAHVVAVHAQLRRDWRPVEWWLARRPFASAATRAAFAEFHARLLQHVSQAAAR